MFVNLTVQVTYETYVGGIELPDGLSWEEVNERLEAIGYPIAESLAPRIECGTTTWDKTYVQITDEDGFVSDMML